MKIAELVEAITSVGPSTMATTTPTQPQGQVSGNVQQLGDPRLQAAQLAVQKQEKEKQKQQVAAEIKAKQAEILALQKQQIDLNKTV